MPRAPRDEEPAPFGQPDAPLRGLMNALDSWLARFSARFSLSDDCATFFAPRPRGDLSDMTPRFPFWLAGEPSTIARFSGKSIRDQNSEKNR